MSVSVASSGPAVGSASISSPIAVHPNEWSLQQVVTWLQSLQPSAIAQQHASNFREQGIEGDVLLHLDADSLREIGVTSIGHRLVLLRSIYDLKRRWNVEIEADDWRPDIATVELKSGSGSGTANSLHAYGRAGVTNNEMLRALHERDERVWALEEQVARLVEWLMRYTDPTPGAKPVEVLQPYWPPARTYGRGTAVDSHQDSSGGVAGRGIRAQNEVDGAGSGSSRGSRTPQTATAFRNVHGVGGTDASHSPYNAPASATLIGFSPTTSTPGATPTASQTPISFSDTLLSKSSQSTLIGSGMSSTGSDPSLSSHIAFGKNGLGAALAPNLSPSSPLSITGLTSDGRMRDKNAAAQSSGNGGETPYKSFRVTLDDPCFKVLPAALKKYKINDDWRQYALFICYGNTERCLSYDEKPLLLFQKLKENKQNPVFMLRHIRDVKSPITIANAKAAARRAADPSTRGNVPASPASQRSGVGKVADAVAKFSGGAGKEGSGESGGSGSAEKVDAAVLNSMPGQPVLSGPVSQLGKGKSADSSRGTATAASVSGLDTYAIAIYPYASEREDEFDVSVGDTFIVKSKVKGWWVVQRDARANGQPIVEGLIYNPDGSARNGGEVKSGWVPAGCLLETRQPLSKIVSIPLDDSPGPGTSPTSPRTPQAASRMEDAQRLSGGSTGENRLKIMSNIPIPPATITSTSTPGVLLMDYNSPSENLFLKKDQRLRVFKRYNHWSYCVEEGGGRNTRAWLPSWYIGKVASSSTRGGSSTSSSGSHSRHAAPPPPSSLGGGMPSKHGSASASPLRSPLGSHSTSAAAARSDS